MSTKFVQEGNVMNVTLGGTVLVGAPAVVGTGILGVALKAGVSGDVIGYAIKGVHKLPKVSGAVITQGQQVYWDSSAGNVDDDQATPAAGDFKCGMAFETAGAGVLEIAVDLNVAGAAVT